MQSSFYIWVEKDTRALPSEDGCRMAGHLISSGTSWTETRWKYKPTQTSHIYTSVSKLCCQTPGLTGFNNQYLCWRPGLQTKEGRLEPRGDLDEAPAPNACLGVHFTPVSPHYLSSPGTPDFPASDICESERPCPKIISNCTWTAIFLWNTLKNSRTGCTALYIWFCFYCSRNRAASCEVFVPWESGDADMIYYCKSDLKN